MREQSLVVVLCSLVLAVGAGFLFRALGLPEDVSKALTPLAVGLPASIAFVVERRKNRSAEASGASRAWTSIWLTVALTAGLAALIVLPELIVALLYSAIGDEVLPFADLVSNGFLLLSTGLGVLGGVLLSRLFREHPYRVFLTMVAGAAGIYAITFLVRAGASAPATDPAVPELAELGWWAALGVIVRVACFGVPLLVTLVLLRDRHRRADREDLLKHGPIARAGWYPDPVLGTMERWWDGAAWSERRRISVRDH